MAYTLFNMISGAHRKAGTIQFETSSAVLSSAGTINSQLRSSATADGVYNNGGLFFTTVGVMTRITGYDASSGQWSFTAGIFSSGGSSAISFGYTTPEFPIELTVELANDALRTLGPLVFEDRSIVSSAGQQVYALSTLAKYSKPFLVEMQGRLGSSTDDPEWFELHNWKIRPSSAGASNLIEFNQQMVSGRDIRVWYEGDHHRIDQSSHVIDERIHPELATLALTEKLYEYRNSRARGAEEFDIQRWNDAKQQLAEARVRWPIWKPKRKPNLMIVGGRQAPQSRIEGPPYGGSG